MHKLRFRVIGPGRTIRGSGSKTDRGGFAREPVGTPRKVLSLRQKPLHYHIEGSGIQQKPQR